MNSLRNESPHVDLSSGTVHPLITFLILNCYFYNKHYSLDGTLHLLLCLRSACGLIISKNSSAACSVILQFRITAPDYFSRKYKLMSDETDRNILARDVSVCTLIKKHTLWCSQTSDKSQNTETVSKGFLRVTLACASPHITSYTHTHTLLACFLLRFDRKQQNLTDSYMTDAAVTTAVAVASVLQ